MPGRKRCCYDNEVAAPSTRSQHILQTVFLDRDGVVNEKMPEGRYVTSWSEFQPLPDVPSAIRKLNEAGLRVLIVSNQRGIALGLYTAETVRNIHTEFEKHLALHGAHVDGFYFCPHDKAQCNCRKPLPGLFEQARAQFPDIQAETSAMVGDSLSDMEFGKRLGMHTVFLEVDAARQKPGAEAARHLADMAFSSLHDAVEGLLTHFSLHPAGRAR